MSSPPSNPPSTRSTPAPRARAGPRAGVTRKTKAERDRYAAEQAQRDKSRVGTASTPTNTPSRGRGANRGNRGGSQKDTAQSRADGSGLGVFGSSIGAARSRDSKKSQQGQEEWLAGGSTKKEEPQPDATPKATEVSTDIAATGTADRSVPQRVVEQIVAVVSDDEPEVERRDIERIWISSEDEPDMDEEDEDDIIPSKGKQRAPSTISKPSRPRRTGAGGLRPVRAPRARLEDEDDNDEDAITKRKASRRTKRETTTAVTIDDSPDAMDIDTDTQPATKDPPLATSSSPELKKKPLPRRPTPRSRDAKLHALETAEDRAERLRSQDDATRLLSIFGPPSAEPDTSNTTKSRSKDKHPHPTNGRLLLLQFPPITPFLTDPSAPDTNTTTTTTTIEAPSTTTTTADGTSVKPDPDATTNTRPSTSKLPATTTNNNKALLPSTQSSHPPTTKSSQHQQQQPTILTAPSPYRLPRGIIGKLNVHASGKVTLDWGGTDMEVRMGGEVDFLQDVVLVEPKAAAAAKRAKHAKRSEADGDAGDVGEGWGDRGAEDTGAGDDEESGGGVRAGREDEEEDGEGEGDAEENGGGGEAEGEEDGREEAKQNPDGKAYALGQVTGKLVVVPDWGKLYD